MTHTPGDEAQRQGQTDEVQNAFPHVWEDDRMRPGLIRPQESLEKRILVEKWKIKSALYYLSFTSLLCLMAILIEPSNEVKVVVLAVWGSTATLGSALLRRNYIRL